MNGVILVLLILDKIEGNIDMYIMLYYFLSFTDEGIYKPKLI